MHYFPFSAPARRQLRSCNRHAIFIPLACCLVLTIHLFINLRNGGFGTGITKMALPRALHLLIPLTSPSLLFCKSLASSILSGYPPPILINFNVTYSKPALARGAKILGIASYLQEPVLPYETSDLVLIADGFDIWYQLPPDILSHRYFESFPSHSVVFGADKLCWPNPPDSPPCRLAPQSTLPKDSYGPETDKDSSGYKVRPRFLNSGTVLGEWTSVENVYSRGAEIARSKGEGLHSDQGVLAEVWGEELVQVLEDPNRGRDTQITDGDKYNITMVMDYESLLFMTMTHSHDDLIWGWKNVTDNPNTESRYSGLPINSSPPTLSTSADINDQRLWLATNSISQHTPVLLHFNGWKFPLGDENSAGWWDRMWWFHPPGPESSISTEVQQMAKDIFVAHIAAVRAGDIDTPGWALFDGKFGGAWADSGQWLDWSELCGESDFIGKGGVWGTS